MPSPSPTAAFLALALIVGAIVTVFVILALLKIWNLPPWRTPEPPVRIMRNAGPSSVPRRATMGELLDSVSWPWRGTPRESEPSRVPSTAVVGPGRGHTLA